MRTLANLPFAAVLLALALPAQSVAIFPGDYTQVPEGPFNSPNRPLSGGTSRTQCLYESADLAIPAGRQIARLGFRQDATLTTMDAGRALQLEIRMGWSDKTAANMVGTFADNYVSTPVTVFGPALFTLPNLRDPANPLPNGEVWIPLTTPFAYNPGGNNLVVEYLVYGTSGGGSAFNYRLDRADYFSPTAQGPAGCPHSGGGTPTLTVQPTRPQLSYTNSASSGPGNSLAVLVISPANQLVPPFSLQPMVAGIAPACTGQVVMAGAGVLTGFTSSGGSVGWSFQVPNNMPLYGGMFVSSQAAFFDFFAPGGVVVSNGAQVKFGITPRSTVVYGAGPPATTNSGSISRNYCPVALFEHQ